MRCAFCRKKVDTGGKVMRGDTCPHCHKDLRCCKQCGFYDPHAYNDCREVMAERIVDKERANFCDFYFPKGSQVREGGREQEARQALEALFKQK